MREITENVKEEIKEMIIEYISEECEVDREEITDDANPQDDLGSDSLMFVELVELLMKKYGVEVKLQSIGKYLLKKEITNMAEVYDMMYKIYQYGNDIVNL